MDVKAYQGIYSLQKATARKVIHDFCHLIKWKNHMEILDVGCGEASTTINILKPLIEQNVKYYKLVALDISEAMIYTAKKTFPNEKNIVYEQMDIGEENVGAKYEGFFDIIFSIFCFHLVPNYKNWITNVFRMLKAGGQIFLLTTARNYIVVGYFQLKKDPKWSPYLTDVDYCDSPLFSMENGGSLIADCLRLKGFKNLVHKKLEYDKVIAESFVGAFVKAFPGMYQSVPNDLVEEFLDEIAEKVFNNSVKTGNTTFNLSIPLFVFIGDK